MNPKSKTVSLEAGKDIRCQLASTCFLFGLLIILCGFSRDIHRCQLNRVLTVLALCFVATAFECLAGSTKELTMTDLEKNA